MKRFLINIALATITLLVGCNIINSPNRESFYTDSGGLDSARLPLIKPYDMVISDNQYGWQVVLRASPPPKDIYYYYVLHDVRKVAVEGNVIMLCTPYIEEVQKDVVNWFVIVPSENLETGFDNESDFEKFIQKYGIKQPQWVEPDIAYKQFYKTGCFDWIPDCE